MHRVRISLRYFSECGWQPTVVSVDSHFADVQMDRLLLESIPRDVTVHRIGALKKSATRRLGFGSLSLRSYCSYRRSVNAILRKEKYDLIYFSTTEFILCALGPYWKRKFEVPYVIDMQDPWYTDYRRVPFAQRPPKWWLTGLLHGRLEAFSMKRVSGLISVSEQYIQELRARYPAMKGIPASTIPFAASGADFAIAAAHAPLFENLLQPGFKNIVYIGRGGTDMHRAVAPLFEALQDGLAREPEVFKQLRFYFIGTSYASAGKGVRTIAPLADRYGVGEQVRELTERIGYYHGLFTLDQADALFIPGSDAPGYIASKILPYLFTGKPLLAVFRSTSPALAILEAHGVKYACSYDLTTGLRQKIARFLDAIVRTGPDVQLYHAGAAAKYDARNLTQQQCHLFEKAINGA